MMSSRVISLNGSSKHSSSSSETKELAAEFGKTLPLGSVVCIYGDLGAGKTTFVSGLIQALSGETDVTSPTFTYVQQYGNISHFDLYRLNDPQEFITKGLDEYLNPHGLSLIEWPEKAKGFLPKNHLRVEISHG